MIARTRWRSSRSQEGISPVLGHPQRPASPQPDQWRARRSARPSECFDGTPPQNLDQGASRARPMPARCPRAQSPQMSAPLRLPRGLRSCPLPWHLLEPLVDLAASAEKLPLARRLTQLHAANVVRARKRDGLGALRPGLPQRYDRLQHFDSRLHHFSLRWTVNAPSPGPAPPRGSQGAIPAFQAAGRSPGDAA